jgi:acetoin utilization deacetylase AcuC-like enzyme
MSGSGVRLRLYYCDHHEIPLPQGHRFPISKYRLLRERLDASGRFQLVPAPPADPQAVELVHDSDYVRAFLGGHLSAAVMRRIGFPWSEPLVRRTLASVGGTLSAAQDALATGFGGNLAGGTHHAFRDSGAGFCVFNDIAVAAAMLRARNGVERIAIVDLDVHQGDGTALIFRGEPDVFTVSIHGHNNFPFRKQESRIDVALPDGSTDEEYLRILNEVLSRVCEFAPEFVFYQSGVDALAADTLGRLALTHEGLKRRDRLVMEVCRRRRIPLVVTLGGGYADPIDLTAEAHANTFLIASDIFA